MNSAGVLAYGGMYGLKVAAAAIDADDRWLNELKSVKTPDEDDSDEVDSFDDEDDVWLLAINEFGDVRHVFTLPLKFELNVFKLAKLLTEKFELFNEVDVVSILIAGWNRLAL